MFALDDCQWGDRSAIFIFFFKGEERELNFPEPHRARDGWQSAKRAAEFWTRACSGAPIVWGPLGVYPRLCLSPTIRTFHRCTKRLFVTIVSPSLRRAVKYNGFKRGRRGGGNKGIWLDTEKEKKELKREITCSFHQPWLHWSMAEAESDFQEVWKRFMLQGKNTFLWEHKCSMFLICDVHYI